MLCTNDSSRFRGSVRQERFGCMSASVAGPGELYRGVLHKLPVDLLVQI